MEVVEAETEHAVTYLTPINQSEDILSIHLKSHFKYNVLPEPPHKEFPSTRRLPRSAVPPSASTHLNVHGAEGGGGWPGRGRAVGPHNGAAWSAEPECGTWGVEVAEGDGCNRQEREGSGGTRGRCDVQGVNETKGATAPGRKARVCGARSGRGTGGGTEVAGGCALRDGVAGGCVWRDVTAVQRVGGRRGMHDKRTAPLCWCAEFEHGAHSLEMVPGAGAKAAGTSMGRGAAQCVHGAMQGSMCLPCLPSSYTPGAMSVCHLPGASDGDGRTGRVPWTRHCGVECLTRWSAGGWRRGAFEAEAGAAGGVVSKGVLGRDGCRAGCGCGQVGGRGQAHGCAAAWQSRSGGGAWAGAVWGRVRGCARCVHAWHGVQSVGGAGGGRAVDVAETKEAASAGNPIGKVP
ncbi:hypothetical protein DFH07DRAFT_784343 [Mycena maculata]|uniref:Uncharacterized protein n=1 Tax=Mycena maculata TaxID=230809 RepID=A0AAD7HHW4_9AGAR|nr:hypothetical protein DFH07DRAFT_784343 [Mycena maculata]